MQGVFHKLIFTAQAVKYTPKLPSLLHFSIFLPISTAKAVKINIPQLGEIILYHHKRAGLSREACALMAGVGKTAVYDLEHGKETIRLDTLLKVIKVLNIKVQFSSPLMEEYNQEQNQYLSIDPPYLES